MAFLELGAWVFRWCSVLFTHGIVETSMKQGQDRTKHGSKRSFGLHGARPGQCFASLCVGGSPRKPVDSRGKAMHQELKVENRSSDWKMIFE